MSQFPIVNAVDRLQIAVRDIGEAERIYTRLLGRLPSWRRTDGGGGTARLSYRLDNVTLEFVAPIRAGPWATIIEARLAAGEGLHALFFDTDDAERTNAMLAERGLPTAAFPVAEATGPGGETRRWRNLAVPGDLARGLILLCHERVSPRAALPKAGLREGVGEAEAISALDHVVVMTSDAEACKRLFGDRFGIRLALDQSKPEWGVRQLFFRLGGLTIEVVEPLDREKAPKADAFWGMAFRVGDVGGVRARLAREGADVSEVRVGRKKGTEVATIRKPTCGVPVLLVGPTAASPEDEAG